MTTRTMAFLAIWAICFGPRVSAGLITVMDMNADSDVGDLLGSPGNDGLGGALSILSVTPTTGAASVTATYRLADVDIDGDGNFNESFDFSITIDNAADGLFGSSTVDFQNSRDRFGIGGNEEFDPDESFRMSGAIISDTSATHAVTFDGFTAIEFESLSGTINVDGRSFTAGSGNNALTPDGEETFAFSSGSDGGPIVDWSVQFSTTAVPEPGSLLTCWLVIGLLIRPRREATNPTAG